MLPVELLHAILADVLAASIHTICLFPTDAHWELRHLATVAAVARRFKAVVERIAARALLPAPAPDDSRSVLARAAEKLRHLRNIGAQSRDPCRLAPHLHVASPDCSFAFAQAYLLYWAAISLRFYSSEGWADHFRFTHKSIQIPLSLARAVARDIRPRAAAALLCRALAVETALEAQGSALVEACMGLQAHMDELRALNAAQCEAPDERRRILGAMRKELADADAADACYSDIRTAYTPIEYAKPASQLPGVHKSVTALSLMGELTERDLCDRARSLVDQWDLRDA